MINKIFSVTPVKISRMKDNTLSRSMDRLSMHLFSITNQNVKAYIKPIVSDLSSDPDISSSIKSVCDKYNALYVHTDTNLVWNKPLALNVGIKMVPKDAKYIATLDLDIIIKDNVFSECISVSNKLLSSRRLRYRVHPVIVARTFMLNEDKSSEIINNFHKNGYFSIDGNSMLESGEFLKDIGNGGMQFFDRDRIFRTKGYDERFNLWGAIDNEILKRAELGKRRVVWINGRESGEDISLVHLYHQSWSNPHVSREYIEKYREENNKVFYEKERTIFINSESWGVEANVVGPRVIDGAVKVC